MKNKLLRLSIAVIAASSAQAAVITTMTATGGTRFNTTTLSYEKLLGPGITASGDVTTWTHANTAWGTGVYWMATTSGTAKAYVDFDLGGTFTVGTAHIWNYNGSDNWDASGVKLIFSQNSTFGDGDDSTQTLTLAPGPNSSSYTGEHLALTSVSNVTHIRLELTDTNAGYRALSEVRFSGTAVPEPGAALLGGLGLLALLRRRRD